MDNKAWKVGDKVLCIKPNGSGTLKAGQEYTIDGFGCCEKCGLPKIYLKEQDYLCNSYCSKPEGCGYENHNKRIKYGRHLFIRPDLSSLTRYREETTVREICVPKELKELSNLQKQ